MGAAVTVASRRNVSAEERQDLAAIEQIVLGIRDEVAVQAAFEAIGAFDPLVVTAGSDWRLGVHSWTRTGEASADTWRASFWGPGPAPAMPLRICGPAAR
ncbi:hypothetical protein [Acidisphaera sp. L21]|uniref:hypothetical protein n=1 Tax=Acidisphaera sp. L21 TaxID=1641851 RepID=UPI001C207372|nr:hypothetical protein [Acidisphaera sp. L21]